MLACNVFKMFSLSIGVSCAVAFLDQFTDWKLWARFFVGYVWSKRLTVFRVGLLDQPLILLLSWLVIMSQIFFDTSIKATYGILGFSARPAHRLNGNYEPDFFGYVRSKWLTVSCAALVEPEVSLLDEPTSWLAIMSQIFFGYVRSKWLTVSCAALRCNLNVVGVPVLLNRRIVPLSWSIIMS